MILLVLMLLGSDLCDNRFGSLGNPGCCAARIKSVSRRRLSDLRSSLVNNYQGRGINVGFGRGCDISDADIPALAGLDLHELYLSRTDINDESVAALGSMKQLQVLDVSTTDISRDGIGELSHLLCDARIAG